MRTHRPGEPSAPLGSDLPGSYRALIERLGKRKDFQFAKMREGRDVSTVLEGGAWTHNDLTYITKGAPVILFDGGYVGTGPFEHISNGLVERNRAGGFYATVHVPPTAVQVIQETEFFHLFMRPWTRWRRFLWEWRRHWT